MQENLIRAETDLERGVSLTRMGRLFAQQDKRAHTIELCVLCAGEKADLSGAVITGTLIRADEVSVALEGTAQGHQVRLTLPGDCYAVPGRFCLMIRAAAGEQAVTLFWGEGTITRSASDAVSDPEHIVPSLQELLSQLSAMQTAAQEGTQAAARANAAAEEADAAGGRADAAAQRADAAAQQAERAAETGSAYELPAADENTRGGVRIGAGLRMTDDILSAPPLLGATEETAGTAGLVPAPGPEDRALFLRGDGTWAEPAGQQNFGAASFRTAAVSIAGVEVAGGGYKVFDGECPGISGYTPVMIAGFSCTGTGSNGCCVYRMGISLVSGVYRVRIGLRNVNTAASNLTMTVTLLYLQEA